MAIDVKAQLRYNREPNILRPDAEMVVIAVGLDGAMHESVRRWLHGRLEIGIEGRLEKLYTLFTLFAAGTVEKSAGIRCRLAANNEVGAMSCWYDGYRHSLRLCGNGVLD